MIDLKEVTGRKIHVSNGAPFSSDPEYREMHNAAYYYSFSTFYINPRDPYSVISRTVYRFTFNKLTGLWRDSISMEILPVEKIRRVFKNWKFTETRSYYSSVTGDGYQNYDVPASYPDRAHPRGFTRGTKLSDRVTFETAG